MRKNIITIEEAKERAKNIDSEINCYQEYNSAFFFFVNNGIEYCGGSQTGFVILKDGGNILKPYEYFMSSNRKIKMIGDEIMF